MNATKFNEFVTNNFPPQNTAKPEVIDTDVEFQKYLKREETKDCHTKIVGWMFITTVVLLTLLVMIVPAHAEVYTDNHGKIIGHSRQQPNGTIQLIDNRGRIQGSYNPTNKKTNDQHGRVIGGGNQLVNKIGGVK
jgi:hypothetical protein